VFSKPYCPKAELSYPLAPKSDSETEHLVSLLEITLLYMVSFRQQDSTWKETLSVVRLEFEIEKEIFRDYKV
jgi:hypothetical protein